mmetsp:Transcript_60162/g.83592  ORF Transcript_60162/g.83592 Transcript_60162/m.83592 type:complete len:93 (-) Transcript_60162:46-324(-)
MAAEIAKWRRMRNAVQIAHPRASATELAAEKQTRAAPMHCVAEIGQLGLGSRSGTIELSRWSTAKAVLGGASIIPACDICPAQGMSDGHQAS